MLRDIYLEDFSQLSAQLQGLHEAVYQRDAFETLNALLIQPTGHYLPLPGGMREVMEQLRTKPIDEIEEDLKAIQTEAKKEASKPPQQDGKRDTETLKQMTVRTSEVHVFAKNYSDRIQSDNIHTCVCGLFFVLVRVHIHRLV